MRPSQRRLPRTRVADEKPVRKWITPVQALTAALGGAIVAIVALLVYIVVQANLQADRQSDVHLYRSAAEAESSLILAMQRQPLRALPGAGMMKSDTSFIYGTLEVRVNKDWSRITGVSWSE